MVVRWSNKSTEPKRSEALPPSNMKSKRSRKSKTAPQRPLHRLVRRYNEAWSELAKLRSEMFPVESSVNVDCGQYVGPGKVVSDCGCPIDKLPVQVGNGNVWWYQIIACSPN